MKKINHLIIRGEIELLSGTRIGGSDDVLQIGGTDLTCIKDPATGKPYIPGSSIKGRMRSGLEKLLGKVSQGKPCGCAGPACPVCRIFGPHMKTQHDLGPTRIIIRDAQLLGDGTFSVENKTESVNNRATGAAQHPRTVERVATGARFSLEIAIQEFDIDSAFKYKDSNGQELVGGKALIEVVDHALFEMEQTGIGAGTGKGYGQIKIHWSGQVDTAKRESRAKSFL
jgi:CRISPR-associated protein Csm3